MADYPDASRQGPNLGAPTDSPPADINQGMATPLAHRAEFMMPFTVVWAAGSGRFGAGAALGISGSSASACGPAGCGGSGGPLDGRLP
jgi:hypothetical protein